MVKTPLIGVLGSGHLFNRKTTLADINMPISKIIHSIIPCTCGNTDTEKFVVLGAKKPFSDKTYFVSCDSCQREYRISVNKLYTQRINNEKEG